MRFARPRQRYERHKRRYRCLQSTDTSCRLAHIHLRFMMRLIG